MAPGATGERAMTKTGDNLRINSERLWAALEDMAEIGPGIAGGCNRQTLTDADGEGRHLFAALVQGGGHDHGCRYHGQHVRHPSGTDPAALPVYMGSHLDTQPTGGQV
jgi:N-carbamoyl-L-amino-acid hydrolase